MMKRENEFRYSQLANILREQILSGYIKPGQFLMSENELCNHYHISRTSVRKSLNELLKENLIVKKAGQGTIVSPDLILPDQPRKVLRIAATSPSYYLDLSMQTIINYFQKMNPGVEVKLLSFPFEDFWESVEASTEQGLQPDLIFLTERQFTEADPGMSFLDLGETLKDSLEHMYPRLATSFCREQNVIAVPVTFSTVYLAYNPNLFNRHQVPHPNPNWTKEDFIQAAQSLSVDTDDDGIVDQYGLSLNSASSRWPVIALQNGVRFNETIQKEPLFKTLTFIHDLLYRYRIATPAPKFASSSEAFIHEKAGMVLSTSIELAGWRNEKLNFEPKVAALPFGDLKSTLLIANAFMVPSESNDKELAVEFIRTAISAEVQETISQSVQFLSVLSSVNNKLWDSKTLESLHIVDESIENSYFHHEVFTDRTILEELEAEMGLYWSGLESAAKVTEKLYGKMVNGGST